MTKKIITLLSFLLALNLGGLANAAQNSSLLDGFMFKPAITLEYQGMDINASSQNNHFKSRHVEQQLKNFDNIALGLNFRVHKYLGFNLNWSKNLLKNDALDFAILSDTASLKIQNMNATTVLYFPIVGDNWLEGFAEVGVSDLKSTLRFTEVSAAKTAQQSHETALLYGAGIQFMPYDFDIAFRFGFQKYQTNLGSLNADITAFRGGAVMPF